MTRSSRIHCRVEIIPEEIDASLTFSIHLDSEAPNLTEDDRGILWTPTPEERLFLKKVFSLLHTNSSTSSSLDPINFPSSQSKDHTIAEPEQINRSHQAIDTAIDTHIKSIQKDHDNKEIIEKIVDKQSKSK